MSNELRERALWPRKADLTALFAAVRDMHCISVVGVSNLGKSALLRSMTDPAVQAEYLGADADHYIFIYVDFNQMLENTEQAFYELVLRCSLDVLRACQADGEGARRIEDAYTKLVAPASSFEVPLRFSQAMSAIGEVLPQRVVFLFDEIDEPLAEIAGRVFLNLRALKDRHWEGLTYVTATNRRLGQVCPPGPTGAGDGNVSEFAELFAHHTHYISLLTDEEIAAYTAQFTAGQGVTFSDEDLAFIRLWAGGHPGLMEDACRVLGLLTGSPVREPSQDWIIHRRAAEILTRDINIEAECRKLWGNLCEAEREALMVVAQGAQGSDEQASPAELESVTAKHLVTGEGPERHIFARAFADFVQRQNAARRPVQGGLKLDLQSGEVWVDGRQIPTLTNLEYRLLLLLYGRLGKICTKYEVVEAVWGEEYMDEVDDARIEKLISRLRQRIEPDVANPRYLITVRGRGYKLVNA
jgi:DNA-binding winged helix-turn-helix (wHTH) protein